PKTIFRLEGDVEAAAAHPHTAREVLAAWSPYILLVVFVLAWRYPPVQTFLNSFSVSFPVPGLHETILRVPPLTPEPSPYPAVYGFQWLSAAGTSCFLSALVAALALGMSPAKFAGVC